MLPPFECFCFFVRSPFSRPRVKNKSRATRLVSSLSSTISLMQPFLSVSLYLNSFFLPRGVHCHLNVTQYISHIRILYWPLSRYRTGRSVQCKRTNEKEAGRGEKNKIMAMKCAAQNDPKTPNCTYIDVLCNLSCIQGTRKYNVNIL